MKIKSTHHISFKHAWDGIVWALQTQPNFRIHLLLSGLSLFFCWFFRVSALEYLVILFTIILGLSAEMINTAIEAMTDLISLEWRKDAKIAKDVSAGMMLLVAMGAMVVGSVVFIPRVLVFVSG